jgi:acyl-CoA thioester hydrolase
LRLAQLGRSSIRYRLGIFAEGEPLAAAQGDFVHVVVDRASRKPVEIPDKWRRAFEAIS